MNIPMNNESIIKRFGFTFAMVNQLKKLDCNKYIKINVKNIIIIDNIFFITSPFILVCYYFILFFPVFQGIIIEIRI